MKSLRTCCAFAALVLWSVTGMAAGLPGIHGKDDRVLVDSVKAPWSAIGRLNRQGGGFCTGVAVGPRTVLTASHCLWNRRTRRWGGVQTIHFLAGYRRGEYLRHARVSSYVVGSGSAAPTGRPGDDWAVLTLTRDLPKAVTPLGVEPMAEAERLLQAGYSQDKPHMLTVDGSCRVLKAPSDSGVLLHDCDATRGSSGAPLLVRDHAGHYAVVGLNIGNLQDGSAGVGICASDILAENKGEKTR